MYLVKDAEASQVQGWREVAPKAKFDQRAELTTRQHAKSVIDGLCM
jgi:hypothetical protein